MFQAVFSIYSHKTHSACVKGLPQKSLTSEDYQGHEDRYWIWVETTVVSSNA